MYEIEPYKCTDCDQIECNHPMVGDKPSLPGKTYWTIHSCDNSIADDFECPGGNNCDCHDN